MENNQNEVVKGKSELLLAAEKKMINEMFPATENMVVIGLGAHPTPEDLIEGDSHYNEDGTMIEEDY